MNSVNIIDPQVFIKCLPAAVPSHKGVKIQARSATVYNASIPTRDEVRHENFKRRQMQMNCQGFKSPIYLPYQGIGEPISLDDKRLILAAIGYRPEVSGFFSFFFPASYNCDSQVVILAGNKKKIDGTKTWLFKVVHVDIQTQGQFLYEFTRFEFRVFFLLDWLPYQG